MTARAAARVRLVVPDVAARQEPLDWLPEAVGAVQGRGPAAGGVTTIAALERLWDSLYPTGHTLVGIDAAAVPVAAVRLRLNDGWLLLDALTVRADCRNLGYGGELVAAAERRFAASSVRMGAGVPRGNGLAVYFWLRTGYRPLYPDPSGIGARLGEGRLWMVREPAAAPTTGR